MSTLGAIDREILEAFIDESQEDLSACGPLLVTLEERADRGAIDRIFRAYHSIKGNASFFGLMVLSHLAHKLEDVLDLARQGQLSPDGAVVDVLLRGNDVLELLLARARAGAEPDDELVGRARELEQELAGVVVRAAPDEGQRWARVFEALAAVEQCAGGGDGGGAALAERVAQLRGHIDAVCPDNMRPEASEEERFAFAIEAVRALIERGPSVDARELQAAVEQLAKVGPEASRELAARAAAEVISIVSQVGVDTMLIESLAGQLDAIESASTAVAPADTRSADLATDEARAPRREARAASGETDAAAAGDGGGDNRTMRVQEARVDEFLAFVGELIVVREMFRNLGKKLRTKKVGRLQREFQWSMDAFETLSHSLQHSIMEVRKVSVRTLLSKSPRIIRDVARVAGKEVRVETSGDDLRIDKSLVELLEAPLVHLARNAADHGIESPGQREASGKPAAGMVALSICETSDSIVVEVRDDGAGIDCERVRAKAVARGIVDAETAARLSHAETYALLMRPGFSTAEKVTDVSGRGVGMDVVRSEVERIGGRIEIASQLGAGTTFTLSIPKSVSVQIVDGFVVRVGEARYVLPLLSVRESFRPRCEDIQTTLGGRKRCVARRGQVIELFSVAQVLSRRAEHEISPEAIVVTVEVRPGGGVVGLLVDEVVGVQQVVVRDIGGLEEFETPFAGGAVLGDGGIAMVVELDGMREHIRATSWPPLPTATATCMGGA
ncbi:MAG: chemotaxis protein CheA [Myxococcales bacterium]|nr:chemotaxis protein CheA [Myxococcales bacterium]